MQIVVQKCFAPDERKDPKAIRRAERALARPLDVLNAHLEGRAWLVTEAFTIADLNLAGVMLLFKMIELDLPPWPNVKRWISECDACPSLARAQSKE